MSGLCDYDIISLELADQVQVMDDADEDDWSSLLKLGVLEVMHLSNWSKLLPRGQLSLATVLISARSLSHYSNAFHVLCEWAFVGGCYWVVQLEVMRHAVLHTIRQHLSGPEQVHLDRDTVSEKVNKLLPQNMPDNVTHQKLRAKLAQLRVDVLWLLGRMDDDMHPFDVYVDYASKYPLQKFVPWFIRWAVGLVRRSSGWFEEPTRARSLAVMTRGNAPPVGRIIETEENKENVGTPQTGGDGTDTQYEVSSRLPHERQQPRAPLQELPMVVSFDGRFPSSPPVGVSPVASSLTCTDGFEQDRTATTTPRHNDRHPSAHGLRIVTDPARLAELALHRKRQELQQVITAAAATCDLHEEYSHHSDNPQAPAAQSSPPTMQLQEMRVVQDSPAAAEAVSVGAGSVGVVRSFVHAVWEAFAPATQQTERDFHDHRSTPDPRQTSAPSPPAPTEEAGQAKASTQASSDSLVYSITTATPSARGYKRRMDDDYLPWGF